MADSLSPGATSTSMSVVVSTTMSPLRPDLSAGLPFGVDAAGFGGDGDETLCVADGVVVSCLSSRWATSWSGGSTGDEAGVFPIGRLPKTKTFEARSLLPGGDISSLSSLGLLLLLIFGSSEESLIFLFERDNERELSISGNREQVKDWLASGWQSSLLLYNLCVGKGVCCLGLLRPSSSETEISILLASLSRGSAALLRAAFCFPVGVAVTSGDSTWPPSK